MRRRFVSLHAYDSLLMPCWQVSYATGPELARGKGGLISVGQPHSKESTSHSRNYVVSRTRIFVVAGIVITLIAIGVGVGVGVGIGVDGRERP